MAGQDLIGQAKTGTGKTLGFGLPILEKLGFKPDLGAKALVVVPTRELAIQVAEDLTLAASKREVQIAVIYGGKAYEGQLAQIDAGAQLIVGTPGRLIDLHNQRKLDLSKIEVMVLDEANSHLDQQGEADLAQLLTHLKQKNTTLVVMTHRKSLLALADDVLVLKDGTQQWYGPKDDVLAKLGVSA